MLIIFTYLYAYETILVVHTYILTVFLYLLYIEKIFRSNLILASLKLMMHLIEQMSSVKLIDSLIDFSIDRYRREKINHNLKNSSKSLTSVYHINELTIGMSKISI